MFKLYRAKLLNEAKRAKEEMAYDLKALEDSLISFQNEDLDKAKRKVNLFMVLYSGSERLFY